MNKFAFAVPWLAKKNKNKIKEWSSLSLPQPRRFSISHCNELYYYQTARTAEYILLKLNSHTIVPASRFISYQSIKVFYHSLCGALCPLPQFPYVSVTALL